MKVSSGTSGEAPMSREQVHKNNNSSAWTHCPGLTTNERLLKQTKQADSIKSFGDMNSKVLSVFPPAVNKHRHGRFP